MKKVFIVLNHSYTPDESAHGGVKIHEQCEFVSQLKSRHYDSASVILDYVNEKVVKDRSSTYNYSKFYDYVVKKYPKETTQLASLYPNVAKTNSN